MVVGVRSCVLLLQMLLYPAFWALQALPAMAAPEAPLNAWSYPLINSLNQSPAFNRPHMPPFRLSRDGRIGMRVHNKVDEGSSALSFFLLAPEKLDSPLTLSTAGNEIVANPEGYTLPQSMFSSGFNSNDFRATTLC